MGSKLKVSSLRVSTIAFRKTKQRISMGEKIAKLTHGNEQEAGNKQRQRSQRAKARYSRMNLLQASALEQVALKDTVVRSEWKARLA